MKYSTYKYKKSVNKDCEHELLIRETENGLILKFSITDYTDNNVWKIPHVVCDKNISIYALNNEALAKIHSNRNEIIKRFKFEFLNNNWVGENLKEYANTFDKINIGLRTTYYDFPRPIANTIWPVYVHINGEDYSRHFMDVDIFKHNKVSKVEEMIFGKFDDEEIKHAIFFYRGGIDLYKKLGLEAKLKHTLSIKEITK
ncbi:MAG: hypothetical protein E7376_00885 [Clostridiales bacterium]|nr:hypothetical protein [Clostridiales bacterium]